MSLEAFSLAVKPHLWWIIRELTVSSFSGLLRPHTKSCAISFIASSSGPLTIGEKCSRVTSPWFSYKESHGSGYVHELRDVIDPGEKIFRWINEHLTPLWLPSWILFKAWWILQLSFADKYITQASFPLIELFSSPRRWDDNSRGSSDTQPSRWLTILSLLKPGSNIYRLSCCVQAERKKLPSHSRGENEIFIKWARALQRRIVGSWMTTAMSTQ